MRFAVIAFVVLAGCIDFHEGQTPDERTLDLFQRTVLPVLQERCAACHAGPNDFLAGTTPAEIRQSLLDSGLVDLDHLVSSGIFAKGAHEGPAMTAHEARLVLDWILAEQELRNQ